MGGSKHSTRDVVDMLRHQIKSPQLQRIKQQQCCFRVHSDCDCVGSIAPLRQCCVFGNYYVCHNLCDCSQFDAQCIQVADRGAPKKPSAAKEDRLKPRLKIHSPHSEMATLRFPFQATPYPPQLPKYIEFNPLFWCACAFRYLNAGSNAIVAPIHAVHKHY